MNKTFLLVLSLLIVMNGQAQQKKIDSSYNNIYYQQRMDLYNGLPHQKKAIVFLGNSITERGPWSELIPGKAVINRGIGGDNTFGVLARLDKVLEDKPAVIFLLIGINDIGRSLPVTVIANNYRRIVERVQAQSPKTTLYLQSVLPMNDSILTAAYLKNKKDTILALNKEIIKLAEEKKLTYINLHEVFADANGDLKPALALDGIHLKPAAYIQWVDYLRKKKLL
ncbi:MAG: family lipase [Ferruginibacter sp.]|nr:family lipase [Ferruginibacter sp.]